jgi:hypothetical protein
VTSTVTSNETDANRDRSSAIAAQLLSTETLNILESNNVVTNSNEPAPQPISIPSVTELYIPMSSDVQQQHFFQLSYMRRDLSSNDEQLETHVSAFGSGNGGGGGNKSDTTTLINSPLSLTFTDFLQPIFLTPRELLNAPNQWATIESSSSNTAINTNHRPLSHSELSSLSVSAWINRIQSGQVSERTELADALLRDHLRALVMSYRLPPQVATAARFELPVEWQSLLHHLSKQSSLSSLTPQQFRQLVITMQLTEVNMPLGSMVERDLTKHYWSEHQRKRH